MLSCFLSSISEEIGSHVINLTTTRDVWVFLEKYFATKSRSRVFQYKSELSNLKKGDKSHTKFVHQAKMLVVNLVAVGCPFDDDDLVLSILNGLGAEFDPIVASVNSRGSSISYDEVVGLLLAHEQRLLRNQPKVDIATNLVSMDVKNSGHRGRGRFRGGRSGRHGFQYQENGQFGRGNGNKFQGNSFQFQGG